MHDFLIALFFVSLVASPAVVAVMTGTVAEETSEEEAATGVAGCVEAPSHSS